LSQDAVPEPLHADLARANLLRMRGEFDAAKQLCQDVIQREPRCAPAYTLLGDIAFDRGSLEEASHFYDLSLEIEPSGTHERTRLEVIQHRLSKTESATTVEQLGLPVGRESRWRTPALIGAVAAIVFTALVLGMSQGTRPKSSVASVATERVSATPDTLPTPPTSPSTAKPEPSTPEKPAPAAATASPSDSPLEDRTILQVVQQRSPAGSHLIGATQDPRTKMIQLTYRLGAEEDARAIGAELARTALEQYTDVLMITLRGVRDDRIAYVADVPRTRYADTLADTFTQGNPEPNAWIAYAVTNEWPSRTPDPRDNPPGSGAKGP